MPRIAEQIADHISGGQLSEAHTQLKSLSTKYTNLYSETRKLTREFETLKEGGILMEGYADGSWNSRLALDSKWQLMSGYAQHRVIQKSDVDLYNDLVAYGYVFSPLMKGAIDIKTRYTFGLSFTTESDVESNKTLIKAIMDDPKNRLAFFSPPAISEADRDLQRAGNIYIAIWPKAKPVPQIRIWSSYEIADVILDPNDADIPLFFVRSVIDTKGGRKQIAYPSIYNTKFAGGVNINGTYYDTDKDTIVYQMSEGRGLKQKWALSPYTSALPWNRAYERFLLDFTVIVEMIRKYSTMFTTNGGNAQVTALQGQFDHENHGRHKGEVGDTIVATEGNEFKVIDAGSGKIVGLADARQILMQFTTSTGVPENLLTGNPQTGNRASAQELTANFLPIIEERQTMWTETFRAVFSLLLSNTDFTVSFPPIRSQDSLTYLQGLINSAKYVQPEDIIRAVYEALDLKVPEDATIEEMVQGIMDQVQQDPAMAGTLDNLTQATNAMNTAIQEQMRKQKALVT